MDLHFQHKPNTPLSTEKVAVFEAARGFTTEENQNDSKADSASTLEQYVARMSAAAERKQGASCCYETAVKKGLSILLLLFFLSGIYACADFAEDDSCVGEFISFGHYEQDGDLTNGTEGIEWQVLAEEDDRLLLVSKYALDAKPYHDKQTSISWETSSLRKWLNWDFYYVAFSDKERQRILTVTVTAEENPHYGTAAGNETEDKIFLLSIEEVNRYLSGEENRKYAPTAYAIGNGASTSDEHTSEGKDSGWWWLRTPGFFSDSAANVNYDGSINVIGNQLYFSDGSVHPAMWITPASQENDTGAVSATPEIAATEQTKSTDSAGLSLSSFAGVQVGNIVTLGRYEQNNNLYNGTEPIEWLVLEKEAGRVLVVSKYALDAKTYNTEVMTVTWETCSLREWLNGEFYCTAFSNAEQSLISKTVIANDNNPTFRTKGGETTEDYVFLLSIDEVNRYFSSNEARMCVPTAYAIANGAIPVDYPLVRGEKTCNWWLRSPGGYSEDAAQVDSTGTVVNSGYVVDYPFDCVRPAMWITIE